ncbi:peptide-methionine (R)-S-oxide reductase MsrB [Falsihalocynthiibacter sp. SS001]|uniref:peptide-methionine (R)-S-oxide reductase MsrB n=1 Tax=Falsihalocynthiibacter sp. SS001 TaxID=3349698 RepID=UPI0036D3668D
MKRRTLLAGLIATASTRALAADGSFEVTRTDAEWRALLTDVEYAVMRDEKTEKAFSSPLDKETREGIYYCKGCGLALYSSKQKYDSGTGWPSFWKSLPNAVRTKPDNSFFMKRTEVHCRRCGSHLGHIFDDGPPPTGKRHCLNGVSLNFQT